MRNAECGVAGGEVRGVALVSTLIIVCINRREAAVSIPSRKLIGFSRLRE